MLNKYFIVQIAGNTFILHNQRLPLTRLPGVELQTKNQLEISCRNFEIISRNFKILSRNFELLSRNFEILCRNFEIISRNFKILSRNFELISRNFALLSRNFDLLCRNFEIVSRNFKITINRNKSVCGPNAPSYIFVSHRCVAPFMPGGPFNLDFLDRSIFNTRGVLLIFISTVFCRYSCIQCKHCRPWSDAAASDLGLHYLLMSLVWDDSQKWVNATRVVGMKGNPTHSHPVAFFCLASPVPWAGKQVQMQVVSFWSEIYKTWNQTTVSSLDSLSGLRQSIRTNSPFVNCIVWWLYD